MPKWSHYLDDEYEDEYEKVEKFKHKPKRPEDERQKPAQRPQPPTDNKK